jgi:signal transduction histidine kinase
LAIVASLVEAHNGSIQIESEPGKGAAFSVYLPRLTA